MRVLAIALLVTAGCNFRVEGTTPPPLVGAGGDTTTPPSGTTTPPDPTPPPTTPDPDPTDPGVPTDPGGTTPPSDMATDPGKPAPPPPAADMATIEVGKACATDADCGGAGLKCFKTLGKGAGMVSLPGGYCSKVCDAKMACPAGSECVATFYGDFCMNKCPATGCRTGYSCCQSVDACGLQSFCGGGGGPGGGG